MNKLILLFLVFYSSIAGGFYQNNYQGIRQGSNQRDSGQYNDNNKKRKNKSFRNNDENDSDGENNSGTRQ